MIDKSAILHDADPSALLHDEHPARTIGWKSDIERHIKPGYDPIQMKCGRICRDERPDPKQRQQQSHMGSDAEFRIFVVTAHEIELIIAAISKPAADEMIV